MNAQEDNSRFTIEDERENADSLYLADAETLRIEKLSNRITLVAVLIPCLLVIVLGIAYLDIKHRVITTQNSGSMGVQNLSKDLESRFSNLSLKQAKLEEQLAESVKTMETATAAIQVKLKKAQEEFKRIADSKSDQSTLDALSKKTSSDISALRKDLQDLNDAFGKFDEELAGQILLMAEGLKKDQGRLAEIDDRTHQLESGMLTKESLDLSLGLERIALQEMVKEKIREVDQQLSTIDKQLIQLDQRVTTLSRKSSSPSTSSVKPSSPAPVKPPSSTGKSDSSGIVEQTIK